MAVPSYEDPFPISPGSLSAFWQLRNDGRPLSKYTTEARRKLLLRFASYLKITPTQLRQEHFFQHVPAFVQSQAHLKQSSLANYMAHLVGPVCRYVEKDDPRRAKLEKLWDGFADHADASRGQLSENKKTLPQCLMEPDYVLDHQERPVDVKTELLLRMMLEKQAFNVPAVNRVQELLDIVLSSDLVENGNALVRTDKFDEYTLYIGKQKRSDIKRCVITYSSPALVTLLDKYIQAAGLEDTQPLFGSLNSAAACKRLRSCYQAANDGVPVSNLIHTLRHTANTLALQRHGSDPEVVKYLVSLHGHKVNSIYVDYQAKGGEAGAADVVEVEAEAAAQEAAPEEEEAAPDEKEAVPEGEGGGEEEEAPTTTDLQSTLDLLGTRLVNLEGTFEVMEEQLELQMNDLHNMVVRRCDSIEEEMRRTVEQTVRHELRMRLPSSSPFASAPPSHPPLGTFTGRFTRDHVASFFGQPKKPTGTPFGSPAAKRAHLA